MEQNTDRMWWTIGAVVLGGILIAGAILLLKTTLLPNIKTKFDEIDRPAVTHTAYSWSSDGTDRFTTTKPNLNLLNFNSGVTLGKYYGWNADATSWSGNRAYFKKVKVTPNNKYTISANWSNTAWLNVYAFTNESDTVAVARYGAAAGGLGAGLWDSNFVGGLVSAKNITFTVPDNINYIGISYTSISTDTLTLQALLNGKPKLEIGNTATPYMTSASEVKASDQPKYIGTYTDKNESDSLDPTKYTWKLNPDYHE